MYLPIIRDPNFRRVVSRAKKVAEACAANALSIDHLRVAALLARRDKALKPSSGWQLDWVGLAEASAKVLGLDMLCPPHLGGKGEWALSNTVRRLLHHCAELAFSDFLMHLFSEEFAEGKTASGETVCAESSRPGARQDPHFNSILQVSGMLARQFSLERVGLELFAVGTLMAHRDGLLAERPSLIHCLNKNQHAIKYLLNHKGWDLHGVIKSAPPAEVKEAEDLTKAVEESGKHDDPLLSVINIGVGVGLNLAQRERVAYHEAGHAVINLVLIPERDIAEVSIEEASDGSDGHVAYDESSPWMITPYSKEKVTENLCVALAGRVAEQQKAGHASGTDAGATSDLRQATDMAWKAITVWGMDDNVGPVVLETMIEESGLRGGWLFDEAQRNLQRLMKESEVRTNELVHLHWTSIEKLAQRLLVKPRLSQEEVFLILPEFISTPAQ